MEVITTKLYKTEYEYDNTIPKPILALFPLEPVKPLVLRALRRGVKIVRDNNRSFRKAQRVKEK